MVQQTPAPKPATEGHASTVGGLEVRSINYVPLAERHGKVWHLWPIWFTGDAHLATIAVGVTAEAEFPAEVAYQVVWLFASAEKPPLDAVRLPG